jgi:hypothetical protein
VSEKDKRPNHGPYIVGDAASTRNLQILSRRVDRSDAKRAILDDLKNKVTKTPPKNPEKPPRKY